MDPLTHGLLGATIGQAGFGRSLGKPALAWGALAAMLPDVDVVLIPLGGPMGEWTYHRGVTHSLLLVPLAALGLAAFASRHDKRDRRFGPWLALFLLALLSHPLLDFCTTYGTQLLSPPSHRRFAIDAIAIIDVFYSFVLAAALLVGWARGATSRPARLAAVLALAASTAYIGYGQRLNVRAEALARQQLSAEGVSAADVKAYPTLLQLYLRRVVAREPDAVRVGWISLWRPGPIAWERFALPRHPLVDVARHTAEGRLFEWFALGQTAATVLDSATGKIVEIDDLRYGFPASPRPGLWGIRVRFDSDGRPTGPVERVDRPMPAPARMLIGQIWRRTFSP
jgi:inner membrane protein